MALHNFSAIERRLGEVSGPQDAQALLREALIEARKCIASSVHMHGFGGRALAQIDAALTQSAQQAAPQDPATTGDTTMNESLTQTIDRKRDFYAAKFPDREADIDAAIAVWGEDDSGSGQTLDDAIQEALA